jgi:hypothetical protein
MDLHRLSADELRLHIGFTVRSSSCALAAIHGLTVPTIRQQHVYIGPKRSARFLLLFVELAQRARFSPPGEFGVGFPDLEGLNRGMSRLGRGVFREPRPRRQVSLEPGDGLFSSAGLCLLVQARVVSALARAGQRSGAGRAV